LIDIDGSTKYSLSFSSSYVLSSHDLVPRSKVKGREGREGREGKEEKEKTRK
jgi:hypothetical protein